MKGKNSTTITIRISDSVYKVLEEVARKKEQSVHKFIKEKVEEYASKVCTNTSDSVHKVPEPSIPKVEPRIINHYMKIKQGGQVITIEKDAEGNPIYE